MEEVKWTQLPTVQKLERAISEEKEPSLADKAAAVALNALAKGQKPSTATAENLSILAATLDNPEVVALLWKSETLLTVLKMIKSTGGTVEKIAIPHHVEDAQFAEILQAAPRLKEVKVPRNCSEPALWIQHLNKETLEHFEAYPHVAQHWQLPQGERLPTLGPAWKAKELSALKDFNQLKFLSLDAVNLDDLAGIPAIKGLEFLVLANAKFKSFEGLDRYPALRYLNLHGADGEFSTVPELPKLEVLDLQGATISDLSFLKHCPNLVSLNLSRASVTTGWDSLSSLEKLTRLDVGNTSFNQISILTKLTELTILRASKVQSDDWSPLSTLSSLKILKLDRTNLTDLTPLKGLTNLVFLSLNHTKIADWSPLRSISSLEHLTLPPTKTLAADAFKGLNNLKILTGHVEGIESLSVLQKLPSLQFLTVQFLTLQTMYRRFSFEGAKRLPALTSLTLMGATIDDFSPLMENKSLRTLALIHCAVPGGLSVLKTHPSLTAVHVMEMPTTDTSELENNPKITVERDSFTPVVHLRQLATGLQQGSPTLVAYLEDGLRQQEELEALKQ